MTLGSVELRLAEMGDSHLSDLVSSYNTSKQSQF